MGQLMILIFQIFLRNKRWINIKKSNNNYYFSVEGETEKWYLEHLKKLINNDESIPYTVTWEPKVSRRITKVAKNISAPYKVRAYHLCDYEGNESYQKKEFENILRELKEVKKINRNVNYKLGYSNYTFELWIILHKARKMNSFSNKKSYLKDINILYEEKFQSLDEYKQEDNFKRVLSKITLEDVNFAIENGKIIRNKNLEEKKKIISGKFEYFEENPDLTIHSCIEEIFKDCKIIWKIYFEI